MTGVTAGLSTLDKRTRDLKKQFSSVTDSTLTWQGALGILAGATGLAFAAKKAFDLGAAVEETASKFTTVFGPASDSVQTFIDSFASMAGLTQQQAKDITATTGAIVQGMGFAKQASADFAVEVVKLAGDFASFNNVPIAQTSAAIQSALTGEREALKKLGVVILEADVQKRALAMTGKENAASLTQQEKATATLALITEKAGVAVGDLERTQDSSANTARRVTAEIMNFRDGLAVAALPALNVFLQAIGESTGGLGDFAGRMQKMSPIIAAWANFVVKTVKTVALALAAPIRIAFNLGQAFVDLGKIWFKLASGDFKGGIQAAKDLVGNFGDMWNAVTDVIDGFDDMRIASGEAWQTMELGPPIQRQVTQAVQATTRATVELTDETRKLIVEGVKQKRTLEDVRPVIYSVEQSTKALGAATSGLNMEIGAVAEAMTTYKGLVGETDVAENTFRSTQEQLNLLLKEGKISQDEYNEAMKVAKERMEDAKGSSGDLRASLGTLLQDFKDLGLNIPKFLEDAVGDLSSKWGQLIAILQLPGTITQLKTDWIAFFNDLVTALKNLWDFIGKVGDKLGKFFLDLGGATGGLGGPGGLTINMGAGTPGGGLAAGSVLAIFPQNVQSWLYETSVASHRTNELLGMVVGTLASMHSATLAGNSARVTPGAFGGSNSQMVSLDFQRDDSRQNQLVRGDMEVAR